jgi:DNA topoisomerase-1
VLGTDPATGRSIVAKAGRYGPYVTEVLAEEAPAPASANGGSAKPATAKPSAKAASAKPRSASLLKSMDLQTVTLDDALRLLTLPRTLGELDGEPVTAQNGRYGPYVKKGTDSRSLENEEQLFTFTLAEAKDLFAQPKPRGRAAAAAATPALRELGEDPASGKPIVLKEGRWGPYATDGETNASLRKGDLVESVTLQRAAELLAERRAAGPSAPRRKAAGSGRAAGAARTGARSGARSGAARGGSSSPRGKSA